MRALDVTDTRRGINPDIYEPRSCGRSANVFPKAVEPQSIVTEICKGIEKALQYLGLVKPHDGLNTPPSLKTLRMKGYILALPTSAQLRLVMKRHAENDTTRSAMDTVCEALDQHHELLEMHANVHGWIKDSPQEAQSIAEAEIESQLAELDKNLEEAAIAFDHKEGGAFLALRNGLRDAEALRGLRTDWRYWEMLGVSPAEYDDVSENPSAIDDWLEVGFSAKEALSFKNAGFEPKQVAYLKGTGATGHIAKQMHLFGYSSDFFPQEMGKHGNQVSIAKYGITLGNHHDAWAENPAVAIGSGAFNTPMVGYFSVLERPRSSLASIDQRVFKKEKYAAEEYLVDPTTGKTFRLQPGQIHAEEENGLFSFLLNDMVSDASCFAPRIGLRNVMASHLAEAMGLTVIVKTEFSARTTSLSSAEAKRHGRPDAQRNRTFDFGISMQRVNSCYGRIGEELTLPSDAEVLKTMIEELIDLQLFDIFTGQIDRHYGNIIIDENGHVFGIDNDQCFPDKNGAEINRLVRDRTGKTPHLQNGVHLPNVITKTQKDRWLRYDESALLEAMPFASIEQKEFAIERLRIIKAHIAQLPAEKVVSRDDLVTPKIRGWLCATRHFLGSDNQARQGNTSYFADIVKP